MCAPGGPLSVARQHVSKEDRQPNENEGVKVGSTCVSAILCAHPSALMGVGWSKQDGSQMRVTGDRAHVSPSELWARELGSG